MKFIHLSDLHLGKRVGEMSVIEDQVYILREILKIAEMEKPHGMVIAGDVYDKSVPTAEAVQLLDDFLTRVSKLGIPVWMISGNHDSPERLSFGARLLGEEGVHISPVFEGRVRPLEMEDEYGTIAIYMIPFLKPAMVRRFFPETEILTYNDGFRVVVESLELDEKKRNVLVAHQFVTGAERCESEDISVGGIDNVDAAVLDGFDYVALGHIHKPQHIKRETVRYCGTPLKYSFSEAGHEKSVTLVDLGKKGEVTVRSIPLVPRRDMREIRGSYQELTLRENYFGTNTGDYLHITLTDQEDIPGAMDKLRVIYPNIMRLDYDNRRTRENQAVTGPGGMEQKSPLEHFGDFYRMQNNQEMSRDQEEFVRDMIEKVWGCL